MTDEILFSRSLSLRAKGMLSIIEHLGSSFTIKDMTGVCGDSRHVVTGTIAELEEAGLLRSCRQKDDKGRFQGYSYHLAKGEDTEATSPAKPQAETVSPKKEEETKKPRKTQKKAEETMDLFGDELTAGKAESTDKRIDEQIFMKLLYGDRGYDIPMSFVETMRHLYPDINVEQSIRDAAAWSIANEDRTKRRKESWKTYLNRWLRKDQQDAMSRNEARRNGRRTPDGTDQYKDDDIGVML